MRKCMQSVLAAGVFAAVCRIACGAPVPIDTDLVFDVHAESSEVVAIAFDYLSGGGSAKIDFRSLQPDGKGGFKAGWMMPISFGSTGFNVDSDYGPYTAAADMSGWHNYVFTLNRLNGTFQLALDGSPVTFLATDDTNETQPDGSVVGADSPVRNGFFSDESETAEENAARLGWTQNAPDGVGGVGAYRITFKAVSNAMLDNFEYGVVPEPSSALLALLGLAGLGLIRWRRSA